MNIFALAILGEALRIYDNVRGVFSGKRKKTKSNFEYWMCGKAYQYVVKDAEGSLLTPKVIHVWETHCSQSNILHRVGKHWEPIGKCHTSNTDSYKIYYPHRQETLKAWQGPSTPSEPSVKFWRSWQGLTNPKSSKSIYTGEKLQASKFKWECPNCRQISSLSTILDSGDDVEHGRCPNTSCKQAFRDPYAWKPLD